MLFIHQKKQKLKTLILVLLGIYLMVGSLLYIFQERLIFLPETLPRDYAYELSHPFEELYFNTAENVEINALLIKAENSKGLIYYHHGNAGNLVRWSQIASYFVTLGYDVLIYDYRTYGKSTGNLSETALYADAELLYEYAKTKYKESEITLYGRSLGTGIATYLGSKYNPSRLILETPYYSLLDVAQSRFPILPVKQLMTYEIPSYQFLKEVNCPIMMIHGTSDRVIPYKSALKLKASVSGDQKADFISIPDGKHNNLVSFPEYHEGIRQFLE